MIANKGGIGRIVVWFFYFIVIIIVVSWIVVVVASFYSKQYDIRQVEASMLANKLMRCIMEDGLIQKADLGNIFKNCDLNLNAEEYYIEMAYTLNGKESKEVFGKEGLGNLCKLKNIDITYAPSCNKISYYAQIMDKQIAIPSKIIFFIDISKVKQNV